jgi:hypothetical protein
MLHNIEQTIEKRETKPTKNECVCVREREREREKINNK